ncbi:hypothetical protein BGZ51_000575 [Haplosporangium sp. Z 767]|nr:hypothetical protein BGZ50_007589 [Haplosporangium sp. Z 11]KAF9188486.1 hypothetical protein BGZ51_000575 [Haplosporangium sp. Z 767]
MSSVKVLVVGSANGDLRNLCSKVGTINNKHGPFDILICTGNFFAKETPMETIDDILEDKLDFPITTYFMHGDHGVPGIIERTALRKQGEVCNNLFYLGSHGVMKTAQDVKIASLSGSYDSALYEADQDQEDFDKSLLKGRYTKPEVDALIQAVKPISIMDTTKRGVDIFLTHEWPAGITKEGSTPISAAPAPTNLSASTFSHPVATATAALQPRYHFATSVAQFWERAPYRNTNGAEHATRFIGLGDVGNKNKQRWFYAFNLVPLANASDEVLTASISPATTDSPLATAAELKRGHDQTEGESFFWDNKRARNEPPTGYVCRRCHQPGHFIKDCKAETQVPPQSYVCNKCNMSGHYIKDCPKLKEEGSSLPQGYICKICNKPGHRIQECPEAASRPPRTNGGNAPAQQGPPPPCWFCLSNPEIDKNLIVSIGTEMYMTMAKGQLPITTSASPLIPGGGHVLLITINHYPSFRTVEPSARSDLESELKKYKDGLRQLYESKGASMVTWELNTGGRMQHAHVQIMAIPSDKVDEVEHRFQKDIESFFQEDTRPGHGDRAQNKAAWQDHLPSSPKDGFFKVELPNGKTLVCPIPERQRIDMQFGRTVLAEVLETPERANWKSCVKVADEERKDSVAFKNVFKAYDFTL